MTREVYLKGIVLLMKAFNINPDEHALKIWEIALQDIDDHDYEWGVIRLIRTREKAPTNIAAAILNEIEANDLSCEEAWAQVIQQISQTGIYGEPTFDDPAITQAVKALRWSDLCNTLTKDMVGTRAHFYQTYKAYRKRATMAETYKMIEANSLLKELGERMGKLNPPALTS